MVQRAHGIICEVPADQLLTGSCMISLVGIGVAATSHWCIIILSKLTRVTVAVRLHCTMMPYVYMCI